MQKRWVKGEVVRFQVIAKKCVAMLSSFSYKRKTRSGILTDGLNASIHRVGKGHQAGWLVQKRSGDIFDPLYNLN